MTKTTAELIDSIAADIKLDSQNIFNDLIGDKMRGALDAKRIEIASSTYGKPQEEIEDIEDEDIQDSEDES